MKNVLSILIVLYAAIGASQIVQEEWINHYVGQDSLRATATDIDFLGNICVSGFTQTASNGQDLSVIKYDPQGNTLFTFEWNNPAFNGNDRAESIASDLQGNIYVTGLTETSAGTDVVTIKLDDQGTLQWVDIFNAGQFDTPVEIGATVGNKIIVVGNAKNNGVVSDIFYLRFNSNNGNLNSQILGSNGDEVATSAFIDPLGRTYITGLKDTSLVAYKILQNGSVDWTYLYAHPGSQRTNGTAIMPMLNGNVAVGGIIQKSLSDQDYLILQLDASGNNNWVQSYNGSVGQDVLSALVVDDFDNVYVSGFSTVGPQKRAALTMSFDNQGEERWRKFYYGDQINNNIRSIFTLNGKLFVCGNTRTLTTSDDYITICYNRNTGSELWNKTYSGSIGGRDAAQGVVYDGTGIYVTGQEQTSNGFQITTIKYTEEELYIPPDLFGEAPNPGKPFVENLGQVKSTNGQQNRQVKFYSQHQSPKLFLLDNSISFVRQTTVDTSTSNLDTIVRVDMVWNGPGAQVSTPVKLNAVAPKTNYYFEAIPEGRASVEGYKRIIYPNIYNGIDLHILSNKYGSKYLFVINPGADPGDLLLQFIGQNGLNLLPNGDLKVETDLNGFILPRAVAYQVNQNNSTTALGWIPTYIVNGTNVSFDVGTYNPEDPLILMVQGGGGLDCMINYNEGFMEWSTYLDGADYIGSVISDVIARNPGNQGDIYSVGYTSSVLFPQGQGTSSYNGAGDMILTRFNSDHEIIWSTYYGGSFDDFGTCVNSIVDNGFNGYPVVGGITKGYALPDGFWGVVSPNSQAGLDMPFFAYFEPVAGQLQFASYIMESGAVDYLTDIAVNTFTDELILVG